MNHTAANEETVDADRSRPTLEDADGIGCRCTKTLDPVGSFPFQFIDELDSRCSDIHAQWIIPFELDEATIVHFTVSAEDTFDLHLSLYKAEPSSLLITEGLDALRQPLPAGQFLLLLSLIAEEGPAPFLLEGRLEQPQPRLLGRVWNTFYILADEESYRGPAEPMLYDARCQPITKVRRAFYNALCMQGSGVLSDGRIVNYARHCTRRCPRAERCRRFPVAICYKVLDPERYPFGMGKAPRPLVPDWSIAVDPSFVPLDTVIYLEELDGIVPPGKSRPHDGCVAAVDTGGGIEGDHIDIFAGRRDRWLAWEELLPTRTRLKAWVDHPRCFRHQLRADGTVDHPASQD